MYDWKPYVPVAERRSKTAKAAEKLKTKSKGKGIYLMAQLKDEKGNSVTEQLKSAINK